MAGPIFDAAVDGGNVNPGASLTWSHTCTGSNLVLLVDVIGDTAPDAVTGVTYNGVAMTLVAKVSSAAGGSGRWIYQYLLVAPATGAHNVVVSAGSSVFLAGHSVSYTAAAQSGQPNAFNTGVNASATSLTVAVTSTVDNCFLVGSIKNDAGAGSAGTGTTVRLATATGGMTTCDRGPVTPAGSSSLQITQSTSTWSGIVCAIAPVSTALANTSSFSVATVASLTVTATLTAAAAFGVSTSATFAAAALTASSGVSVSTTASLTATARFAASSSGVSVSTSASLGNPAAVLAATSTMSVSATAALAPSAVPLAAQPAIGFSVTHGFVAAPTAVPAGRTGEGNSSWYLSGSGNVFFSGAGPYQWVYTFVTAVGETDPSPLSVAVTVPGGGPFTRYLTIGVGPTGTIARNVYRLSPGSPDLQFVGTIADNTTVFFSDHTVTGGAVRAGQNELQVVRVAQ